MCKSTFVLLALLGLSSSAVAAGSMEGRPVQHVLGKRSSVVVRGPANSRVYRWTADRTSTSNGVFQTEHVRGTRVAGSTRYQLSAGRYTMERGNLGRFHIITVR